MSDVIKIKFRGLDYTNLKEASVKIGEATETFLTEVKEGATKAFLETIGDSCSLSEEMSIEEINKSQKRESNPFLDILLTFLDSIEKKKNIINVSNTNKKKHDSSSDIKLYDKGIERYLFQGVVGIVKDEIEWSRCVSPETPPKIFKLEITLQIQSRLDKQQKDGKDEKPGKPYFLSTMLLRDNIKLNDKTAPSGEEELYDYLLLFWFKERLQEAYLKGFYRTYRRFEENNNRLKGSIDVARHIRLNMGQDNGRLAYSYRENTVNNYLNHLIIVAYEHLKKKYSDMMQDNFDNEWELKSIINQLKTEIGFSEYNSRQLIFKNMKPISHPYYTEYEELRKICIKILRDEAISLFDGDENDTKGLFFYLPDLWELYLEDAIKDKLNNCPDISMEAQQEIKVFQTFESEGKSNDDYMQETNPDYVFAVKVGTEETPFMILDAKFKPDWEKVFSRKKLPDLSDYNKCLRDMTDISGTATGVIFPTNQTVHFDNSNSNIGYHRISMYNSINVFYVIPVNIPYTAKDEGFLSWKSKMDKNLNSTMDFMVQKVVQKESEIFCNKEYQKAMKVMEDIRNA